MSKYCTQCGKERDKGDKHCKYCGALLENTATAANTVSKKKPDILVPVVAVISVILVIAIVAINLTVLNNGYKKPIDSLFAAIETGDTDYLEDAVPDYVVKSDDYDSDKMKDKLKDIAKVYGEDVDISYYVEDKVPVEDEELEKLEDETERKYDENIDAEQGYKVKLNITFS